MPIHGLANNGLLQLVEEIVMVLGLLGRLHECVELLLECLPSHLHTLHAQLIFGPLLQLDVHCRVERA